MPIYAYRCESCGHAKDVLQKVSDPLLTTCPACGADSFRKQLTAAGFQLKGSGWYVTDFRNNNSGAGASASGTKKADAPASDTKTDTAAGDSAAAPAPAAASGGGDSAPAAGCGTSCACH